VVVENEKENSFKIKIKKQAALTGVDVGTVLYCTIHAAHDPHVQSLCDVLADYWISEAATQEN
jgi:hypothetical protein